MNKDVVSIDSLPDEVLEFILSKVSPYGDLKACGMTCHRWHACSRNVARKSKIDFTRSIQQMRMNWSVCTNASTAVISESHKSELHRVNSNDAQNEKTKGLTIGKRYSHSSVYDDLTDSMYVFGGCTSTATTFNDLWRLDLTTRRWHRPIATGTYPSPKACSILVKYGKKLILFGGWTHPSMYPLHRWRLFNELHSYDLETSTWTQLLNPPPAGGVVEEEILKPPTMAGHSATVHKGRLIIFGGLQKQRNSIGQFSSSSDVWSFDLDGMTWLQEDIPEPRPTPRYGQSQLYLDETHLLVLGGCGGPSNIFNDVWLLTMGQSNTSDNNMPRASVHWKWERCRVENSLHGANHMWCHPAVKVGDYAVMLGKNKLPKQQSSRENQVTTSSKRQNMNRSEGQRSNNQHEQARWNVIPQLQRGVNRGYGAIRRPQPEISSRQTISQGNSEAIPADNNILRLEGRINIEIDNSNNQNSSNEYVEPMTVPDEHNETGLAVIPIDDFHGSPEIPMDDDSPSQSIPTYRSCVTMNVNNSDETITNDERNLPHNQFRTKSEERMEISTENLPHGHTPSKKERHLLTSSNTNDRNSETSGANNNSSRLKEERSNISASSTSSNTMGIPTSPFKVPPLKKESPNRQNRIERTSTKKLIESNDPTKVESDKDTERLPTRSAASSTNSNSALRDSSASSQVSDEKFRQRGSSNPKVSAISFNSSQIGTVPRLQAFAVNSTRPTNSTTNLPNNAKSRQQETRQRQLDSLKRMEERYRNIASPQKPAQSLENSNSSRAEHIDARPNAKEDIENQNQLGAPAGNEHGILDPNASTTQSAGKTSDNAQGDVSNNSSCSCQRLTIHVLDISKAISNHVVTWKDVRTNSSIDAPEETILYSLVKGKSELVMFGGIQKDVSSLTRGNNNGGSSDGDTVSNAAYFLNPLKDVV